MVNPILEDWQELLGQSVEKTGDTLIAFIMLVTCHLFHSQTICGNQRDFPRQTFRELLELLYCCIRNDDE